MSQVAITLPDGSVRSVPAGTPVRGVAEEISPNLAKAAVAGIVDGKLVDLTYPLDSDAAVRIVTDRSPEALPLFRHPIRRSQLSAVAVQAGSSS
jgi:threonyl-tRNA synthetase